MYNQPNWTKSGTKKIEKFQNTCIQMSNLSQEVLKIHKFVTKETIVYPCYQYLIFPSVISG